MTSLLSLTSQLCTCLTNHTHTHTQNKITQIKIKKNEEEIYLVYTHIQDWETDWQMHFNPDKCELIRITNKRKTINAMYQIHGVQLKQTKKAKYLGLTFTSMLSWNAHIDTITKQANNTTAFLWRNLSMCPRKVKDTCYKTFVKPQVEYAATVWDPHTFFDFSTPALASLTTHTHTK